MNTRKFCGVLVLASWLGLLSGCGGGGGSASPPPSSFSGDLSNPFGLNGLSLYVTMLTAPSSAGRPRAGSGGQDMLYAIFSNLALPSGYAPQDAALSVSFRSIVTLSSTTTFPDTLTISALGMTPTLSDLDASGNPTGAIALPPIALPAPVTLARQPDGSYIPDPSVPNNGILTIRDRVTGALLQQMVAILGAGQPRNKFNVVLNATTASSPELADGTHLNLTIATSNLHFDPASP